MTRDLIQGFIDGHKLSHTKECLETCLISWLKNHHTYPQGGESVKRLLSDIGSYTL